VSTLSLLLLRRNIVHVIELPSEVRFAFYGLLNHLLEFADVLVHQVGRIHVQRLFDVGSLNVLQQVQQSHSHLVELVNGFPSCAQDRQTDVSLGIDVGVQNLIQAPDFGGFVRVLLARVEGKGDARVSVERPLFIRHDFDDEISDRVLFGKRDFDVFYFVFIVLLQVDFHALFGSLEVCAVVLL